MKRLLVAFVLAGVVVAILRTLAGQRSGATGAGAAAGGNGSHHQRHRDSLGAEVTETIDEAIEVSASELSGTPAATGRGAVEGAENN